jgi:signal transduction histidine kinase/DNA-binding response OmpR family regulator
MNTPFPPTKRVFWSRITNSAWGISIRRGWQWITRVKSDDPVRYVLNRGFAYFISVLTLILILLALATVTANGFTAEALAQLITIPVFGVSWWLNRQGTSYGAALFAFDSAIANAIGINPIDYAGLRPTVLVPFVFPILVSTLFIRPRAGIWACLLQMAALGIALRFSSIPPGQAQQFMIIGTLQLGAVVLFLMVGTTIFSNALRTSIDANNALQQLNAELEQRVTERTAELATANRSLVEARDAAEQARAAAEEASQYKTRFLANMSHELRTPLNAVINFAHFLADTEYGSVTEQQRMFQSRILYNGEHLLGLINDILDLSKIEAGKMELNCETVDLRPLLHGVMSTAVGLTRDKGLSIDLEADNELPQVWIDKTRIRQVLLNLLSNAAKFTDRGGITMRVSADGSALRSGLETIDIVETQYSILNTQNWVTIAVIDTGIGIPVEEQARVFEEFQQVQDSLSRSYQGTGLGLPISKRLVEMHGGRMWLESTPGVGSTFSFTIPVASPAQPGSVAAEAGDEVRSPLIAVIDDDVDSQQILRTMLEPAGYYVQSILDSQVALEELRRVLPSLIVLDLKMEPLDGWTLLGQIREDPSLAAIPVVICSVVDPASERIGVLNNVAAYLRKPVRQEDVLALLRQFAPAGTILVVDDDPDARQVLKHLLARLGQTVVEAPNGSMALALIPEIHPHLVLLDLMMPEMDGFEVLEHLQEMPAAADLAVVVVTSKDLDAEERTWLRERTYHCLQKPVSAPEFRDVVRNVLKGADHGTRDR